MTFPCMYVFIKLINKYSESNVKQVYCTLSYQTEKDIANFYLSAVSNADDELI